MNTTPESFEQFLNNVEPISDTPEWRMRMLPCVLCKDGFSVSIQASSTHYCSPRDYVALDNYDSFELGFPSQKEDTIMEYAENPDDPTNTVYGWVPRGIVTQLIEKHGGIVKHVTPEPAFY